MSYKIHVISTNNERLTSGFGMRTLYGVTEPHNGLDFTDAQRIETIQDIGILAFADGKVVEVGICTPTSYATVGNTVAILHEGKILTRYQHMKDGTITVKVGDTVEKGQKLGVMGTTGKSTGIHLHFAVKENSTAYTNGVYVDPTPYLTGEKTVGAVKPVKPDTAIKVGGKVAVLLSAKTYATGQTVPSWVKGNTYAVKQVKDDRVLLDKIMSWVYIKDVMKA